MYKNQLQELSQRSCFNLPSYTSIREGPDHAPRFKTTVNFNGETYESPSYCSTLRQAEHSAAEVALNVLASRGPTNSLAARILHTTFVFHISSVAEGFVLIYTPLHAVGPDDAMHPLQIQDETGVYKNLLQEVSQRVGASLPAYTTFRSGLGHLPVFTGTVELAGVIFTGDPAKSKKQAEKNTAMAAWLSLKSLVQQFEIPFEKTHMDEQEHVTVARALQKYLIKARLARIPFPIKFPTISPRPSSIHQSPATTSKILPLICPKTTHCNRPILPATSNSPSFQNTFKSTQSPPIITYPNESPSLADNFKLRPQNFPAASAPPYIPVRHCNPHNRIAPLVTVRNAIPVFSAPPLPSPQPSLVMRPPALGMAPPVFVRQAVPVFSVRVCKKELPILHPVVKPEDPRILRSTTAQVEEPPFFRVSPVPNSEVPTVRVGLPSSEVSTVQVEPVAKVSSPPVNSKAPADKTRIAVQDKLQESKEIEDRYEDMIGTFRIA